MGGGYAPNDVDPLGCVNERILVESPASIANLGPGFDILALAIDGLHDRVLVEAVDGSEIEVAADKTPSGRGNSAYAVAEYMLRKYSLRCGVRIRVQKGVPVSAGLGSSGATSAAVAYALNELYALNLPPEELLEAAAEGEYMVSGAKHYDNVAASLLGGLVVVGKETGLGVLRLDPPEVWLGVVIIRSGIKGKTGLARSLLPKRVGLRKHVAQTSALAMLLVSAYLRDPVLFGRAVSVDLVAEPVRKTMIPLYDELKATAIKEGAMGFNISGAGPSVFVVHVNRGEAERIATILAYRLRSEGVEARPLVVRPSKAGAVILDRD